MALIVLLVLPLCKWPNYSVPRLLISSEKSKQYSQYLNLDVFFIRPEMDRFKRILQGLGADLVLTDSEISADLILKKFQRLPDIAFNCVGGQNATSVLRTLT